MGSLPKGTLCCYCGIREASYIPDGCVGPLCLGDADSCYELAEVHGWAAVVSLRLARLWRMLSAKFAKAYGWQPVFANMDTTQNLASFLWNA